MKRMLILSSVTISGAVLLFTMFSTNSNTSIQQKDISNPLVKKEKTYQEVFKEIKPIDKVQELSKQQKFEKITLDSKELIAKADKLILDKNLKVNKINQIDREKLDKRIAHLQNKIEELR